MSNTSFTSKRILGEPKEPAMVQGLMKTKLFRSSRQAGITLVLLSLTCWVAIAAIASSHVPNTDFEGEQKFTERILSQVDRIFFDGFRSTSLSDKPSEN